MNSYYEGNFVSQFSLLTISTVFEFTVRGTLGAKLSACGIHQGVKNMPPIRNEKGGVTVRGTIGAPHWQVKYFKIKEIPFYSDIKFFLKK